MKKLALLIFLIGTFAFGQNSRYDGIANGPRGPIGNAQIAVCSQPATISTTPCSPLANLCSSLTDATCTSPNPFFADFLGNFHFYMPPGSPVTVQVFGQQVTPYVLPDQVLNANSLGVPPNHFLDLPSIIFIPAALCNNATPATTWSLPTTAAATPNCATGTNTQVGVLSFADGNSAQATYYLPPDWDSSSSVDSSIMFASSSTTGTVIFNIAASCTNVNGTQTDDQAFNAAAAYPTTTLSTPANAVWSQSLTGLTVTNCSPGELLHLKISRATDTAADTGVAVRGVSLTMRRTF